MTAVFVGLHSLAVGTVCGVLWFLLVGCTLMTLSKAFYLLPGCWSDQGSCELAMRRTYVAELAGLSNVQCVKLYSV